MIDQLTPGDFAIRGRERQSLCLEDKQSPYLVMIRTQRSAKCDDFWPHFQKLSQLDKRIKYGVITLTNATRQFVVKSMNTSTPIKSYPTLILYAVTGKPFAMYKGMEYTGVAVQSFITNALQKMKESHDISRRNGGGGAGQPKRGGMMPMTQNVGKGVVLYNGRRIYMPDISTTVMDRYNYIDMRDKDYHLQEPPEDVIPYNIPWKLFE